MQHKLKNYGTSNSADKTASSWAPTNMVTTRAMSNLTADTSLLRLRHGVTRPPQGQHRGRLTIAIEHAHTCGHWGVMLSEVERYMEQFKLEMPRDSLRTPTSWLSRISRASMKRHPTENIPRALHMRTLGLHAHSIGQAESTDYAMYGIDVCL
jgi:hypothetical protein